MKHMKQGLTTFITVLASVAAQAVDFTGPGGDLADKANWGGTLPSETTAVSYPAAKYPSGGYTLSDTVTFKSTTIPTGYASPALFNLGGHAYVNASAELDVKSDATFTNGSITNAAKAVRLYADSTLTVEGPKSVLRIVSAVVTTEGAGATLCLTNGAKFYPGGSGFSVNKNNVMYRFTDKAEYDASLMSAEYNIANVVSGVANFRWTFDDSRGTIYTLNWGGKSNGALGVVQDSVFEVLNGSDVFIGSTSSRPGGCVGNNNKGGSRGLYFGKESAGNIGKYSLRNKFIVRDSTFQFTTSQGNMRFCGSYDQIVVSNSTFRLIGDDSVMVYGYSNTLYFADSTVTSGSGALKLTSSSVSNRVEIVDCTSFPEMQINGTNNSVKVDSDLNSAVTLAGWGNVFEIVGGKTLSLWPTMTGENLTLDFNGGIHTNKSFTFSGTNRTVLVRNGGELCHDNQTRNDVKFVPNATKDFTLRIEDGTFVSRQAINFDGNEVVTYNWTNCPNCAIEFAGMNPKFVMKCSGSNYESLCLGTPDEEPLTDAVRLRFVIGEDGYAEAPMQNLNPNNRCDWWICGNQPIDIRLADGFVPTAKMRVPLFYDVRNFVAKSMNAERLAKLTANATFPDAGKYKTSFVYVSADKTLYAEIKPRKGLCIVFR